MSGSVHVWLIQPCRPASPEGLRAAVARLAAEPGALPWWLAWLGPLGARLWTWWWAPRLLIGPTAGPDDEQASRRARDLERLLGDGWSVRAVHDQGAERVDLAASHLSHGAPVALVELCPLGGPAARALLGEARIAAIARSARLLELPPLHTLDGWREAVAEALRAGVADLARGARYEVLFCALGVTGSGPELTPALDLVADVVARSGLARPHHIAFVSAPGLRSPTLDAALLALHQRRPEAVVVVPLNAPFGAEPEPMLSALRIGLPGVDIRLAPEPYPRATSTRALCELLRAAAAAPASASAPARSA